MWSFGIGMIIYYDYDFDYINWLERTHDRSAYSSHAATTELLSYTYLYIHTYIYIYIYIYIQNKTNFHRANLQNICT